MQAFCFALMGFFSFGNKNFIDMAFFNRIFPGTENQNKYARDVKDGPGNKMRSIPIKNEDESFVDAKNPAVEKAIIESKAMESVSESDEIKLENVLSEMVKESDLFIGEYEGRLDEAVRKLDFNDEQKKIINDRLVAIFDPFWSFIERHEKGEKSQEILDGLKMGMEKADAFLLELPALKNEMEKASQEEEEKKKSKELLESKKVEVENIFDSLDEKIEQLVPGENELVAESSFLDEFGKIQLDGLVGQDLEEMEELIAGAKAEISKRWKAKELIFAEFERSKLVQVEELDKQSVQEISNPEGSWIIEPAQDEVKETLLAQDPEVAIAESQDVENVSIGGLEDIQKEEEKNENVIIAEQFRRAARLVEKSSLSKEEFEKQYATRLGFEIEGGDLEKKLLRYADIIEGHHEDTVSREEQEDFWNDFTQLKEFVEKMNEPEYSKKMLVIEGRTYVVNKDVEKVETAEDAERDRRISDLMTLVAKVRNHVHYIDKGDFANKSVSNKDKVYDRDFRKDLAYFLANGELSYDKDSEDRGYDEVFQRFEKLVKDAYDGSAEYVVYGDRTYVTKTASDGSVEMVGKENRGKKKHERPIAGLSENVVEIFRKNAAEFVENLKNDGEIESVAKITQAERDTLLKIYTKRFLRERIAEKESVMKEKMNFIPEESEELVEAICDLVL